MSKIAQISIASGPDSGKSFSLDQETMHIGSGSDNEIIIEDDLIAELQASIARKNGRYAIYCPFEGAVDIDGTSLPPEKWVWLPASARIQISRKTVLLFEHEQDKGATTGKNAKAHTNAGEQHDQDENIGNRSTILKPRKRKPKKSGTGSGSVAKFITEREGDPLVQLGVDGKLPELALQETEVTKKKKNTNQKTNPNILYLILAISFFSSLMMVLIDDSGSGAGSVSQTKSRKAIKQYYDLESDNKVPFQRELREAELAHARGDRSQEKRHFRRVLYMLNAEDVNKLTGLTGEGPAADEELRQHIINLLR